MATKNLAARYGLVPMERSYYLVTPTRHIPARSVKRFVGITDDGSPAIWHERPADYYLRGYAILAADGGFKSFAIYCQVEVAKADQIEEVLANAWFGCYGFEVWS